MNEKGEYTGEKTIAEIKREAAEWVTRHDCGLSSEQTEEFFEWLAEDPRHGEYFEHRLDVWKELDLMEQWKPTHSSEPNPDLLAKPVKAIQRGNLLKPWLAAAAMLIFSLSLWIYQDNKGEHTPTMLAEGEVALAYQRNLLSDGSIVELNRGAQASVNFTNSARLIALYSGEAHFTVKKDSKRPFVVRAGDTQIKALGTAFNVSISQDNVEVFVTEGRVWLDARENYDNELITDQAENPQLAIELSAGQRSIVNTLEAEPLEILSLEEAELNSRLSWKSEVLEFTNTPLSEVILAYNRRNHTQIIIMDETIGARSITATLRPNNLQGFIQLLDVAMGINVVYQGDSKILLFESIE